MDIHCRFCGEPWDLDCFHNPPDEPYDEKVAEFVQRKTEELLSKALREVQRENPDLGEGEYKLRAFARAQYKARAAAFSRFGCRVFGSRCNPDGQMDPALEALQQLSDEPEEWTKD